MTNSRDPRDPHDQALDYAIRTLSRVSLEVQAAVNATPASTARDLLTVASIIIEDVYSAIRAGNPNADRIKQLHEALNNAYTQRALAVPYSPPG